MYLEKRFVHFIAKNCDERSLLLGLSGGPDSMALFHLLLKSEHPFKVAHVDHGWREESKREAEELSCLCEKHQIPFFLLTLEKPEDVRNLEDVCRQKRLKFFAEIVKREDLQGVVLGHHADDQAETVLKRVFEGASFQKLKGLDEVSDFKGLKIFRPLLSVSKNELVGWLEEKGISYFVDSTNEDVKFLRSRFRKTIFPLLNEEFGKEITSSLCRMGKNAKELASFIEEQISPFRNQINENEESISLDFSKNGPQSSFLWKAVIRDFFNSLDLTFSDSVLETLVFHLQKGTSNVEIRIGKRKVKIEKKNISVSQKNVFK